MTDSDVSFLNPPVREVNLTIWFDPIHTLAALHLSPLRTAWQDTFSRVEEKAPLAPWNAADSLSILTDKWPMPACVFASLEREKQVLIQNDRFSLTWYFTQTSQYPGFAVLSAEFQSRYLDFIEALHDSENPDPVPTRTTIEYENLLDRFDSNIVARRITANEPLQLTDADKAQEGSTAIRKHVHKASDQAISTLVGIDSTSITDILQLKENDSSSGEVEEVPDLEDLKPELACLLTLSGRAEVSAKDDVFERLQAAHDATIELFSGLFDEALKSTWGRR